MTAAKNIVFIGLYLENSCLVSGELTGFFSGGGGGGGGGGGV